MRAASMQKLLAERTSSGGETSRATTVVRYLGCQAESQGNTRAEAQMRVIKASKAQTRYSCGLWAPRSIGLGTKIRLWQTLVRSILLHAAEALVWLPRNVKTLEKWQNRALRHIARSPAQRTQDLRMRLGGHTVVSTLQVRRLLWAKKWLREETYPEDEDSCRRSHERNGCVKRAGTAAEIRPSIPGRLG